MLRTPLCRSAAKLGRHAKWQAGTRSFNATTKRKAEVQLTIDGKQVSIEGRVIVARFHGYGSADLKCSGLCPHTSLREGRRGYTAILLS